MLKKRHCCFNRRFFGGCRRKAEFSIYGSSGHPEDITETCEKHVGGLLGTPTYLKLENKHWVVYPIKD